MKSSALKEWSVYFNLNKDSIPKLENLKFKDKVCLYQNVNTADFLETTKRTSYRASYII